MATLGRWVWLTILLGACEGPEGPSGPQGRAGTMGLPGENGDNGMNGASGPVGAQGPAGAPGQPGLPGATGATGPVGPPGAPGVTGPAGPTGATGAIGPTGVTGPTLRLVAADGTLVGVVMGFTPIAPSISSAGFVGVAQLYVPSVQKFAPVDYAQMVAPTPNPLPSPFLTGEIWYPSPGCAGAPRATLASGPVSLAGAFADANSVLFTIDRAWTISAGTESGGTVVNSKLNAVGACASAPGTTLGQSWAVTEIAVPGYPWAEPLQLLFL